MKKRIETAILIWKKPSIVCLDEPENFLDKDGVKIVRHIIKETIKNKGLLPFRGPINKLTVSCGEDLKYRLINNDSLGFKNPNDVYQKDIDLKLNSTELLFVINKYIKINIIEIIIILINVLIWVSEINIFLSPLRNFI